MTIPTIEKLLLPLLERAGDKKEHKIGEFIDPLADYFKLGFRERRVLQPSGREPRFNNRVRWAKLHLKGAGVLEDAAGGRFRITERGLDLLKENLKDLDFKYLLRFQEYADYRGLEKADDGTNLLGEGSPDDQLAEGYEEMRRVLARDLMERLMKNSPSFFEKVVVDLILEMGYGGSRDDVMQAVGGPHDGGIDAVIKVDKLGLDLVCIQSKRKKDTVSSAMVQAFVGSFGAKKASKGVFVTTSRFSEDATVFAQKTDKKVVLIDGEQLVQLMIDHNIGVTETGHIVVKAIDSDYFEE